MRALYNLHIPFAIAFLAFVVLFAIIYPLLMRVFARKHFSCWTKRPSFSPPSRAP